VNHKIQGWLVGHPFYPVRSYIKGDGCSCFLLSNYMDGKRPLIFGAEIGEITDLFMDGSLEEHFNILVSSGNGKPPAIGCQRGCKSLWPFKVTPTLINEHRLWIMLKDLDLIHPHLCSVYAPQSNTVGLFRGKSNERIIGAVAP